MALNPSDRFQSAGEIIEEIDRWMVSAEVHTHRYHPLARIALWTRRHSELFGAILFTTFIVLFTVIMGLFWVKHERDKAADALTKLQREKDQRIAMRLDSLLSLPPAEASAVLSELRMD